MTKLTGVFVFDSWLRKVIEKISPINVILQYHDEILLICKHEEKEFVEKSLLDAIKEVNAQIGLNVEIGVSVSWGENYAECH